MENKKYLKSILQIGDNDLVGNKFNGHEAHKALIKKGYSSSHLVWNKESKDKNTYVIAGDKQDRLAIRYFTEYIQNLYDLDNVHNPLIYDIIYNKLFLHADIVHLHLMHNGLWDLNLLPVMSKLKPIIWSVHDMWIATGSKDANERADYYFPLPKVTNVELNWYIKKDSISRSNVTFLVASRYMEKNMKEHSFFKNKEVIYLPYGLDTKVFYKRNKNTARAELGIDISDKVVIFRGDGGVKKGLHYVEHVMKSIGKSHNIHFLILGGNDVKIPNGVRATWFGWVKDDELMAKIYSAGDLFLMPSTRESFGMMAIEAMACGTLPIVIEGTSLPETVNHPECGVATPQDQRAFTKTVEKYLLNESQRLGRERLCIEYVNKKHNMHKHIAELEKIYQRKLANFKIHADSQKLLDAVKEMNSIKPAKIIKKENFFYNVDRYLSKSKFIDSCLSDYFSNESSNMNKLIDILTDENRNLNEQLNRIYKSKRWVYSSKISDLRKYFKFINMNRSK